MSHYFTDNRQLEHNRKEISFRFLGISYSFITDTGVFSKDKVDTGSTILLEAIAKEGIEGRVLDYGCGYGVIGIVLAKQFGVEVVAADVNQRALELASENAATNQVKLEMVLIEDKVVFTHKFSNIVLNPPIRAGKEVIYQMFSIAHDYLEDDGDFYIVIRKQHGAESAVRELKKMFPQVVIIQRDKGFQIVKSSKGLTT